MVGSLMTKGSGGVITKLLTCPKCQFATSYFVLKNGTTDLTCYECGLGFPHEGETTPGEVQPKTQKLRGMKALQSVFLPKSHGYSYADQPVPLTVRCFLSGEPNEKDAKDAFGKVASYGRVFARPCPLTPRHGFVDSREVKSFSELHKVWEETIAADPEGEVMLVNYIDAKSNIVLTPNFITIGKGHDGATAGKDALSFPLMPVNFGENIEEVWEAAGLDIEKSDPYIEAVMDGQNAPKLTLTQLRSGPKVGGLKADFIPTQTSVSQVVVPNGQDLLEWEKLILSLKDTPGVVVNNIGGSPVDHYSVHARTYNIPVVTTREVSVGEVLEPLQTTPVDPQSILEGLTVSEGMDIGSEYAKWERAMCFSFLPLHNSGAFEGKDGFWLGVGAGFLLKFGISALKGEARHINSSYGSRSQTYTKTLPLKLNRLRAMAVPTTHLLRYGKFSGNVGGRPWALCGAAIIKLLNSVGKIAKEGSQESVGEFIRAYNFALNQAHNGGWWLNKFTHPTAFDKAAENDFAFVTYTAPFALEVRDYLRTMTKEELKKGVEKFKEWDELDVNHAVPITAATIDIPATTGSLVVKVKDRVLGDKHKLITVDVNEFLKHLSEEDGLGKLYVGHGPNGLKLELKRGKGKGMKCIPLWEDKPLEGTALKKS